MTNTSAKVAAGAFLLRHRLWTVVVVALLLAAIVLLTFTGHGHHGFGHHSR